MDNAGATPVADTYSRILFMSNIPAAVSASIYIDWEPANEDAAVLAHYEVKFNGQYGCDSGRKRFVVKCLRCGELLHSSTTWPSSYIKDHEKTCGNKE